MSEPALYTVGWICAISPERVAARQFLDEEHDPPKHVSQHDNNVYTLGRMRKHNVVIAALPDAEYGIASAATVARDMLHSFPNVRIGLMVGIGGGAPSLEHDIRLGDIVVSSPGSDHGGIYQYDFGETVQARKFRQTKLLDKPPLVVRTAVSTIKSQHEADGNQIDEAIKAVLSRKPRLKKKYKRPDETTDRLYKSDYVHTPVNQGCETICGHDTFNMVQRCARGDDDDNPAIHYGLIASANQDMKDATIRDALVEEKGVLCFEMEAAGLMNHFPCLVIRGICDYADSHKNEQWQGYAAMAAAAYAKEVLASIAPNKVEHERKITETLASLEEGMASVNSAAAGVKATLEVLGKDTKYYQLHNWLLPPDHSTNHDKASYQRHEGTGQWFLRGRDFATFSDGHIPFLWLHGITGCGKTILSFSIIEELQQRSLSTGAPLLYFYFDFNENQKQTLDGALRSLLWQLATHSNTSQVHLDHFYSLCKDGRDQPSTQILAKTFDKMLQELGRVQIVLDALDECTTRKELLKWLEQLTSSRVDSLHIIVASRKEQDIEASFRDWATKVVTIPIEQHHVDVDIRAYVQSKIRTGSDLARWRDKPKVQEKIESELMGKASGMFRWAACQLDSLANCLHKGSLLRTLETLPTTLEDTYARVLEQLPAEYLIDSIRILQVLTWSERPLRIDEAVDYLAVNLGSRKGFDIEDRMPDPGEIAKLCSSLITVVRYDQGAAKHFYDERAHDSQGGGASEELRLAHFSVKEYLRSNRLGDRYKIDLGQTTAAACIAKVSLTYLLNLEQGLDAMKIKSKFPLAGFSAAYWMQFSQISRDRDETVKALGLHMLSTREAFVRWLSIHDPDGPSGGAVQDNPLRSPHPLYYASLGGLVDTAHALIARGADVNVGGGYFGTNLQAACAKGHENVARILLDNGAKINARGCFYDWKTYREEQEISPLYTAVILNDSNLVKMLLGNGADMDAQGGRYGDVLQAACAEGYGDIVRILLDGCANVHAQGGQYMNALQAACTQGHWEVAEMLLANGADVNSPGGRYGNALQAACVRGHENLVSILLTEDAKVNARGGEYGNALQAACAGGHEKAVKLLLSADADANAEGGKYGNALQAACFGGHEDVTKLLIANGARINAPGGKFGSPLQAACFGGHEEVTKTLLEAGANVNARSGYYGNALQTACYRGHRKVAKILLENSASVDARGGRYGNALQAACTQGHWEVAEMLLANGADVNSPGGRYGNALQAACVRGHEKLLGILLTKGAKVNARGGEYGNALQAACAGGHEKAVKLLLSADADANAEGGSYGNALNAAYAGSFKRIAQMLLIQINSNRAASN